jgi:IclR family transcriptional regulator, pca regulon regulatory protein
MQAPRARFAFVQSLERGLAVIKSFGGQNPEQSIAEVAIATGLDRFSARRLLLTLEATGYVELVGRHFRLRPQTLQLGYAYLSSLPWWHTAQRVAERLTAKVGTSSAVGVLDRQEVVYVAYASAQRYPLLWNRSVGMHLPAATTAIGRILLASLPASELREWLASADIQALTARTRTSRPDIAKALEEVRAKGYAFVDQELEIGLRSLGVAIKDKSGSTIAALSVSIVEGTLTNSYLIKSYLAPLQDAVQEIYLALPA